MINAQPLDMARILPEIILSVFAVLIMVLEPFVSASSKKLLGWKVPGIEEALAASDSSARSIATQ